MSASEFGKIIRDIRSEYRLTAQDFGNMYDATYQMVSRWERGYQLPNEETIKKICDDFEIDLNADKTKKSVKRKKTILIFISIIAFLLLLIIFYNAR